MVRGRCPQGTQRTSSSDSTTRMSAEEFSPRKRTFPSQETRRLLAIGTGLFLPQLPEPGVCSRNSLDGLKDSRDSTELWRE